MKRSQLLVSGIDVNQSRYAKYKTRSPPQVKKGPCCICKLLLQETWVLNRKTMNGHRKWNLVLGKWKGNV